MSSRPVWIPSRRKLAWAIVGICLLAGQGAADAQGPESADRPLLSFSVTQPFQIKWVDLKDGESFELFNESTRELSLTLRLTAFRSESGKRLEASDVLTVSPTTKTILGGDSIEVALNRARSAREPPAGSYDGSLAVLNEGGDAFSRLKIALLVRREPAPDRAEPLVDSLTIEVYRRRWGLDALGDLLNTDWFRDRYPPPGDVLLPLKTTTNDVEPPSEPELGTIQRGKRNPVVVTYLAAGPPDETGHRTLKLKFAPPLGTTGEYEGALDLLKTDKDAGVVTLKIVYSDFMLLPLLIALAGVVAGVIFSRFLGVLLPTAELRRQITSIRTDYKTALRRFPKPVKGRKCKKYDIAVPLQAALGEIEKTLSDLGREHARTIPTEALTPLKKAVGDARAQVSAFTEFAVELKELDSEARAIVKTRPPDVPRLELEGIPCVIKDLRAQLLCGRPLRTFKLFEDTRTEVKAAIAGAARWQELERGVGQAQKKIGDARKPNKPNTELDKLEHELHALYTDLWERTLVSETEAVGKSLADLRDRITLATTPERAAAEHEESWMDPDRAGRAGGRISTHTNRMRLERRRIRERASTSRSASGVRWNFGWILRLLLMAAALVATVSLAASKRAWRGIDAFVEEWLGGWRIVGLLILVSAGNVAVALSTDYAGKVFGSGWDYLKLAGVGFGATFVGSEVIKRFDSARS
jgi:hypothetical protein